MAEIRYNLLSIDNRTKVWRTFNYADRVEINLINKMNSEIDDIYGIFYNGLFIPKKYFTFKNYILNIRFNETFEVTPKDSLILLIGNKNTGTYLFSYRLTDTKSIDENNPRILKYATPHPELAHTVAIIVNGVLHLSGDTFFISENRNLHFKDYLPHETDDIRLIQKQE